MASLIFLIIDIKILVMVMLPYISSYFITSELCIRSSSTNTRNNDPIITTTTATTTIIIIITITIVIMISTTIFQNITETEKLDIFCFHNFEGVIAVQCVICNRQIRKGVIKLKQIVSKHKQAFIPTAI